jgi:hypothetical protein
MSEHQNIKPTDWVLRRADGPAEIESVTLMNRDLANHQMLERLRDAERPLHHAHEVPT